MYGTWKKLKKERIHHIIAVWTNWSILVLITGIKRRDLGRKKNYSAFVLSSGNICECYKRAYPFSAALVDSLNLLYSVFSKPRNLIPHFPISMSSDHNISNLLETVVSLFTKSHLVNIEVKISLSLISLFCLIIFQMPLGQCWPTFRYLLHPTACAALGKDSWLKNLKI